MNPAGDLVIEGNRPQKYGFDNLSDRVSTIAGTENNDRGHWSAGLEFT